MHEDIAEVLLTEDEIHRRVGELGRQITADYRGRDLLIVFILKGALLFVADLVRCVDLPVRLDFMVVSSYGRGASSPGSARIVTDLRTDVHGRHVLLVEDIVDSGHTIREVLEHLLIRQPASLRVCTLLDKPDRREVDLELAYIGFTIPNVFVVGYCLDYNERYRNLPYVGVLKPDVYA